MNNFFKNKRVLITGHTGFKGSWLLLWLKMMGAEVYCLSQNPKYENTLYSILKSNKSKIDFHEIILDIRNYSELFNYIEYVKPDIVFHLAAQAIVSQGYIDPYLTFTTNVMGTLNILECIRNIGTIKAAVLITSDKCYKNIEQIWSYREIDRLGGDDPYSSSKASCELLIHSYLKSYFFSEGTCNIASVRAGNVVGGGDWSSDRLIPDSIRNLTKHGVVKIRNPNSTRPWLYVLEPLRGYLMLAEKLFTLSKLYQGSYNFGPVNNGNITVKQIADLIISFWGSGSILLDSVNLNKESTLLSLDSTKSGIFLDWKPKFNIDETIKNTILWYKNFHENKIDMYLFSENLIHEYVRHLNYE